MRSMALPYLVAAMCALSVQADDTGEQRYEWRRVAFLPPPTATQEVYRHTINLGRGDWWTIMPMKIALDGSVGGVFSFKMNGKPLGELSSEPYEILAAKDVFKGEFENELEIKAVVPPSKWPERITLFGRYPSVKGPLISEEEFFKNCIDTTLPALSGIPALCAAGDMAGARRLFADYVRSTLRPAFTIANWLAWNPQGKQRLSIEQKAADVMCRKLETLDTSWHFADHKVEWEFNPTHNGYREWNFHISYLDSGDPLAVMYLLTHDEKYAVSWKDLILSFLSYNPVPFAAKPGETKCWRSLDSSARANNILRQFNAFVGSPACDDLFITTLFRSIWEHARRLRTGHAGGGNWLTNEMSTLTKLSIVNAFFKDSAEWREYAIKRLEAELAKQIPPDGFQAELSPMYHSCVMQHYLGVVDTAKEYGTALPPSFMEYIEKMFAVYTHLARPDMKAPGVNDSKDVDPARLMERGVRLFPERQDFRWFATHRKEGAPPAWKSCQMPYAGLVAMRNSWNADGVWGFMDCGPLGMAHVHEDKLNVLVSAYGKNMLVEAGTYEYDTSDMRRYVLSTRGHNTVRIDGMDQNRLENRRFNPQDIQRKAEFDFCEGTSVDWARAAYEDGYGPGRKIKVRHERTLMFHKAEAGLSPFFVVIDRLSPQDGAKHSFEQLWHLETCGCEMRANGFTADFGGGLGLVGEFSTTGVVDMIGSKQPELQGWIPIFKEGPHEHRPVHTPVLRGNFEKDVRVVVALMPFRGGTAPIKGVRASSSTADRNYTVVLTDGSERTFAEP